MESPVSSRCLMAAILVLHGWVVGCAPARGGWEVSGLSAEQRLLVSRGGGRISDLLPQFAPQADGLSLFLCRWPTQKPIDVSLPKRASPRELRLLRVGLAAWESAGLGISFREVEPGAGRLDIEFPESSRDLPEGAGDAVVDCRMQLGGARATADTEARLVWASIHLARSLPDWKGDPVTLQDDELLGAILHELGHALGFSGHVASGNSIMVTETDKVRRIGERVAAGQALPAPELVALYSLPSGIRVGHRPLDDEQDERLRKFLCVAQREGLRGPFGRVGDRWAQLFYRDGVGRPFALTVKHWPEVLKSGRSPVFVLGPGVEKWMEGQGGAGSRSQLRECSSSRARARALAEVSRSPRARLTSPRRK